MVAQQQTEQGAATANPRNSSSSIAAPPSTGGNLRLEYRRSEIEPGVKLVMLSLALKTTLGITTSVGGGLILSPP